ncbi:MAG TPA: hypothetical protein VMB21_17575 [Candidatus Limnocylindria bacterium]|nr:hypothetical protein [Candidatus Limnocylindria bacterium]
MNDDFYIGYLDRSPAPLARHSRRVVLALGLLLLGAVALLAARQAPADPGTFEFGVEHTFEGVLEENPLPLLHSVSTSGQVTNYLLVGEGKHGLPAFARGHEAQRVHFQGSLIQKGTAQMVEMNDEKSFTILGPASAPERLPASAAIGDVVLTGELVDTKCYFGVMRPAVGKVHRACAVRCLSGGVPPGLLVRDDAGNAVVVLLTGTGGRPLKFDVQWAAREVRVTGRLSLQGTVPQLEATVLELTRN